MEMHIFTNVEMLSLLSHTEVDIHQIRITTHRKGGVVEHLYYGEKGFIGCITEDVGFSYPMDESSFWN